MKGYASRMGLEPLEKGLRLHDRLCVEEVEEEGRDTPAMVTCKSRASLATTPAAFACESLATVACESSAARRLTLSPASPRRCRLRVLGGDIRHRRL